MAETLILILLCSCSTLSIIAGAICFIFFRKRARKIMTVAPGLEVFLRMVSPIWFLVPLSLTTSITYTLFGLDFYAPTGRYIRSFMISSAKIIDFSPLVVSIDCVVASLTKTQDPLLTEKLHGYITSVCCIIVSTCCGLATHFYSSSFAHILSLFSAVMHIVCFLTEVIMLFVNIRRRKVVPFDYELSIRHKLVRNIKLLKFLCPFLFITTLVTTIGPRVMLYLVHSNVISLPTGVQLIYSCYNAVFLLVVFVILWKCYKQTTCVKVVCIDSNQDHFQQLKAMWR